MSKCKCTNCNCKDEAPNMLDGFCPYCGGKMYLYSKGDNYYYRCGSCHSRSPLDKTKEGAVAKMIIAIIPEEEDNFTLLYPCKDGEFVIKKNGKQKTYKPIGIIGSYNDMLSFRASKGGSESELVIVSVEVLEELQEEKSKSRKKSNRKKSANDNGK